MACLGACSFFTNSIAHQTRQKLDYNKQCLAEGWSNLAGGFFQCLPGSGSLRANFLLFKVEGAGGFAKTTTFFQFEPDFSNMQYQNEMDDRCEPTVKARWYERVTAYQWLVLAIASAGWLLPSLLRCLFFGSWLI
jgi:hypothetical protein